MTAHRITVRVIRHGQAVSNLNFGMDDMGNLTDSWHLRETDKNKRGPHFPGRNFFRVPLTPAGIFQCLDRQAELAQDRDFVDNVAGIFSSPLERCVQTAILTTPVSVLRRCNFTITILHHMQEAVKFPCDMVSSESVLLEQVGLIKRQYVRQLRALGRDDDAAVIDSNDFTIDWGSHADWTYTSESFGPGHLINEPEYLLVDRASGARAFFQGLAAAAAAEGVPRKYLVYTHGQFFEHFTGLFASDLMNCQGVEMSFSQNEFKMRESDAAKVIYKVADEGDMRRERSSNDHRDHLVRANRPDVTDRKAEWLARFGRALDITYIKPTGGGLFPPAETSMEMDLGLVDGFFLTSCVNDMAYDRDATYPAEVIVNTKDACIYKTGNRNEETNRAFWIFWLLFRVIFFGVVFALPFYVFCSQD